MQCAITSFGNRQIRSLTSLLVLTNLSGKPNALKSQTIVRAKICKAMEACLDAENPLCTRVALYFTAFEAPDTALELIDIGVNLTHESFEPDLPEVLTRARQAGVQRLVVTGADIEGSRAALELANSHDTLWATAGIHPHYAEQTNQGVITELEGLLQAPRAVAVGETGLDFFRDLSPRSVQEASFEAHLDLAARSGLPMFLHERDAHARFAAMLRARRQELGPVVVHCFTGSAEALHNYLDLDCHIGITGWICDERRGTHLQSLVNDIPSARLLLETDAPYLMPRTIRPKPRTRRNEPAHLAHLAEFVASLRNTSAVELADTTTANAEQFFGLREVT